MKKFWEFGSGKGTFKPKRKVGGRGQRLHDYARTLGMGSMRSAVAVPESENREEWIAVNTVDLFNEVSLLYGVVVDSAGRYSKVGEGFPAGYEYRWPDPATRSPMRCSAPQYVDFVMTWVDSQLADDRIFPASAGQPFPRNFNDVVSDIFKRLFRVYAIIYHSLFDTIEGVGAVEHLNTSFKHFMFFAFEFSLVPEKELNALQEPVKHMRGMYVEAGGGGAAAGAGGLGAAGEVGELPAVMDDGAGGR